MRRVRNATAAAVEKLERRTRLSGSALSISPIQLPGGGAELRIDGTPRNDRIHVGETPGGLLVSNRRWSRTITGSFQSMVINGGAGNDWIVVDPSVHIDATLYGGSGRNLLQAGSGDDTLVSIGSKAATLIGGSGRDSFWMDGGSRERALDVRPDEIAAGDVHRVGTIFGGQVGRGPGHKMPAAGSLRVRGLAEPATTDGSSYHNFSNHPLFSTAGPSENDVVQGDVGDCYFLSVLSSVARIDPWKIRQSVLDMGDGTYLVQFGSAASPSYVRVDGQLPTLGAGAGAKPDYAGFGAQESIWVAIVEKAYTIFHGPTAGYASIDGGWMDQAYAAIGFSGQDMYGEATAGNMLTAIQQDLSAGLSVTYAAGTPADGAPLLGSHAYTVDGVNVDAGGNPVSLTLRNPWGIDGAGNDGSNDGYVTVTPQQAFDSTLGVVSAAV